MFNRGLTVSRFHDSIFTNGFYTRAVFFIRRVLFAFYPCKVPP